MQRQDERKDSNEETWNEIRDGNVTCTADLETSFAKRMKLQADKRMAGNERGQKNH